MKPLFQAPGNLFPVVVGIPESRVFLPGALEVHVHIMVPRKAYAAVNLDTVVTGLLVDIAAEAFCR